MLAPAPSGGGSFTPKAPGTKESLTAGCWNLLLKEAAEVPVVRRCSLTVSIIGSICERKATVARAKIPKYCAGILRYAVNRSVF